MEIRWSTRDALFYLYKWRVMCSMADSYTILACIIHAWARDRSLKPIGRLPCVFVFSFIFDTSAWVQLDWQLTRKARPVFWKTFEGQAFHLVPLICIGWTPAPLSSACYSNDFLLFAHFRGMMENFRRFIPNWRIIFRLARWGWT